MKYTTLLLLFLTIISCSDAEYDSDGNIILADKCKQFVPKVTERLYVVKIESRCTSLDSSHLCVIYYSNALGDQSSTESFYDICNKWSIDDEIGITNLTTKKQTRLPKFPFKLEN